MNIDVVVLEGVLDSALGVTLDVLAAANRIATHGARSAGTTAPFKIRVVGTGHGIVSGTGRPVAIDAILDPRMRRDALVVLGMNMPIVDELAKALDREDVARVVATIRREHRRGTMLCASCSATFLLACAGVLDHGVATTSWWLAPEFRLRFPSVDLREDAMVVSHGAHVVTAGAALAQLDLMLWLVRRVAGPTVADLCARYLVIDERPSQGRFMLLDHLQHRSDEVTRAEAWARRSLHRRITVGVWSRAIGTSPRTLDRRIRASVGVSPGRFLSRLRAERAVHLLTTTKLSLEEIATRVGYRDPVSLRRLLRLHALPNPKAIRSSHHGWGQ